MALPPSLAGADHATVADSLPAVAAPSVIVGAPGTVAGVTAFDEADAALFPTLLVARTVKVYGVPLVSPVTVADNVAPLTLAAWAPGEETAVYPVTTLPPSLAGAVQVITAEPSPRVAVPIVGAPGTVAAAGVTELEAADSAPGPTLLVAWTVKVYAVPLVSPPTVTDKVLPLAVVALCAPGVDVAV
jgi:hypothetical protein